jgi:hypothetical protein
MPSAASLNKRLRRWTGLLAATVIVFAAGCRNEESGPPQPVFSRDIAPILFKRCTPCHRPGSAGPFNLLSYRDARKKMRTIRRVLENNIMPPWPADTTYSRFRDEKILPAEEKELVLTWIRNGAPPGDTAHPPLPPDFPEGSRLGIPDLTIRMDTFRIEGNNLDHFMMIKVPYQLPADTFVRAIEILPGNKKLAHHINGHLVQYAVGAKKNLFRGMTPVDAERHGKREAFAMLDLQNDDGTYPMLTPSVTNYLPGVISTMYPNGIGGYRVKKEGVLLLDNIHYGPSPIDTFDCTTFNFFFGPTPPERPVHEFILGTSGLSPVVPPLVIPPDTVATYRTQYTLPEDISLLTINPHMHLLGKSFLAYAVTPDRDTLPLIRINQWDFRWQYFYTFRTLLPLHRGTTIYVEGVYDNTESNPLNPFHPPQTVSERDGSMRTTDEMFQFIITYTRYRPGDENISLEIAPE